MKNEPEARCCCCQITFSEPHWSPLPATHLFLQVRDFLLLTRPYDVQFIDFGCQFVHLFLHL